MADQPMFDPFASVPITDLGAMDDERAEIEPITEDEAVKELKLLIDDAIDFMGEMYAEHWENAQLYFDGGSSVEKVEGQSRAVATVVRDAIRAAKPSIMRVLTQSPAIVEFRPTSRISGPLAEQQTLFTNSTFYRNGGYSIISDAFQDASLKRIAAIKWWYDAAPKTCYATLTDLNPEELQALAAAPSVKLHEQTERSIDVIDGQTGQPTQIVLTTVEVSYQKRHGQIRMAAIPLPQLFYDRNASCVTDAAIIGHQRNMRVADVLKMGIAFDDVEDLDSGDPELSTATSGESTTRRKGIQKREPDPSQDPMAREILITEAYASFDLLGAGDVQLWKFILGGTDRRILKRERVDEVQICIATIDPVPHTPSGLSFYDILGEDQDTQTSALRGTLNNLHQANNRRLAYHDSLVNGKDVVNSKLGAPIRFRAPGMIQEIGVTPVIGAALPLLEHLRMRAENKIGVTAAATGLDPDALQSTDKDAVMNTIKLSMGQIELMTRNFAQSLVPLFRGLLKLSLRHFPSDQEMEVRGQVVPVNTAVFDPDIFMEAAVGLGTSNVDEQRMVLQTVMQQQTGYIKELGPSNPFCDFSHVSRAQEDLLRSFGCYNPDRYFRQITPEQGKQIADNAAKQQTAEAEAAKQIPPQHVVAMQLEDRRASALETQSKIKALSDQRAASIKAQQDALAALADDDFRRDELAQARSLEFAKINNAAREAKLVREQKATRDAEGNTK